MLMMYLLFIFCLFFIRILAGYDSRFQTGKYISIKNPVLRVVFLDSTSLFERTKRRQKDRGKMSVVGLVYYIAASVVIIINLVFLLVAKIPIEPWGVETNKFLMYTDTLNEKVCAIAIWLLLLSVFGYMAFLMVRFAKTMEQKWLRIFVRIVAVIMLGVVGCVSVYMLKELVSCFYNRHLFW